MKKFNLYIIIATIFAVMLNSCNPQEVPEKNSIELTKTDIYSMGITDYLLPNIQLFLFSSATGNLDNTTTDEITGSGYGFDIIFSSYVNEFYCPITKQEKASNTSLEEAMENPNLIEPGKCVMEIYKFENGEIIETINIENFTLSFEPNTSLKEIKYKIETTINNENVTFTFNGKPNIYDYLTEGELKHSEIEPNKITQNIDFPKSEITYGCTTAFYQNTLNTIEISFESDEWFADFICYGSPENKKDVYGTYTLSKEHNIGTASPSPGAYVIYEDGEKYTYIFPSAMVRFNYTTQQEEYFMIKNGSITIEENKIHFDITSYNGSNISGSYEGKLDIMSEDERYEQYKSNFHSQKQRLSLKNKIIKH